MHFFYRSQLWSSGRGKIPGGHGSKTVEGRSIVFDEKILARKSRAGFSFVTVKNPPASLKNPAAFFAPFFSDANKTIRQKS